MAYKFKDKHLSIVQFILERKQTTYQEIAEAFNLSNKTVGKYIEELKDIMDKHGINLEVKRGTGVQIHSTRKQLQTFLSEWSEDEVQQIQNREMYIYSKFLSAYEPMKIQDLADEVHVSRATMENTIRDVRKMYAKDKVEIKSNREGLILEITEKQRRRLMSKVINFYWSGIELQQTSSEEFYRYVTILNSVDNLFNQDILQEVIQIVNEFIDKSKLQITDYEYQSLCIHLVIAIERINKKHFILKDGFPGTHILEHSKLLIEMLESKLEIEIPINEQKYINIHIIAIEKNAMNSLVNEDTSLLEYSKDIHSIIHEVLWMYQIDEVLINNLTIHLNAAIKRLALGLSIHNPYKDKIKNSFRHSFELSAQIAYKLESRFQIELDSNEVAYIALHMQAFFERDFKMIKNVAIVCSSGYGTSMLLEQRIRKQFASSLNIVGVYSIDEIEQLGSQVDLILSTIPIEESKIPVVTISPLLNEMDIKVIEELTKYKTSDGFFAFTRLIGPHLYLNENVERTQDEVLEIICNSLVDQAYIEPEGLESSKERERLSSTALGSFAMPHAQIEHILKPCIFIYVNTKGVLWGEDNVKVVFFFAMHKSVQPIINELYEFFNELVSNTNVMKGIVEAKSYREVEECLEEVANDTIA